MVLEKAVPEPVRPKEPTPSAPQPAPPSVPQVRTFNETQRGALLEALTAAKTWRPGQKPKAKPEPASEVPAEEAP